MALGQPQGALRVALLAVEMASVHAGEESESSEGESLVATAPAPSQVMGEESESSEEEGTTVVAAAAVVGEESESSEDEGNTVAVAGEETETESEGEEDTLAGMPSLHIIT